MDHLDKSYFDPQVNLEIDGEHTPQFIVDLISQVNILLRSTWVRLGQPKLEKYDFYLKLVDQGLVQPLGI